MITPEELAQVLQEIEAELKKRFPKSYLSLGVSLGKSKGVCEAFEQKTNIRLSDQLCQYFKFQNQAAIYLLHRASETGRGWNICAQYKNLDFITFGEQEPVIDGVYFGGFMFGKKQGSKYLGILYDETIDPEVREQIEALFFWGYNGDGNFILLDLREPNEDPEVYLLRYPSRLFKLSIRFWDYLDHLLKFRGVFLWERYFTENPDHAAHPVIRDGFHENFKEMFPEAKIDLPPQTQFDKEGNHFEILASQRNYAERFDRMVDELRKKEGVQVAQYERWPGVPIFQLQKGWYGANGLLNDDMLAFYSRVGKLRLLWHHKVGGQTIAEADFLLSRFDEMMGGKSPRWEFRRHWDHDVNERMGWTAPETAGMRLFYEGPYGETLVSFDQASGKPVLYALQEDEPFRLTVDFREYMELLLENGGMARWQFFLTDPAEYDQLASPARFQLNMRRLFPGADLSRYRKK